MLKNTADALGNTILLRCLPCKLTCWTYACHCLQTGHAQDNSDEDDNTEPTHQSPWELFDEGLDAQQAVQEGPALDSPVTDRLKHAVQALSASEHFELFVDLVDPDAAYPASDTGWTLLSSALLCHAVLAAMSLILLPSHTSTVWCRPGIWMLRELLSPKTSDIRNSPVFSLYRQDPGPGFELLHGNDDFPTRQQARHCMPCRGADVLQHHGSPADVPIPDQRPAGAGVLQAGAGRDGRRGHHTRQCPGLQWGGQSSG